MDFVNKIKNEISWFLTWLTEDKYLMVSGLSVLILTISSFVLIYFGV